MRNLSRLPKKQLTQEEGFKLARAYAASDMTQQAFADSVGIHVARLGYWIRLARKEAAASAADNVPVTFMEIPATASKPVVGSTAFYKLQLPTGVLVDVPTGFCPRELNQLLNIINCL